MIPADTGPPAAYAPILASVRTEEYLPPAMSRVAVPEVSVPIVYRGEVVAEEGFRMDLLVDETVVVELKSVEEVEQSCTDLLGQFERHQGTFKFFEYFGTFSGRAAAQELVAGQIPG